MAKRRPPLSVIAGGETSLPEAPARSGPLSARGFLETLTASRLVPPDVIDGMRAETEADAKFGARELAFRLEQAGHLTPWQSQQLLAGKSQFFLRRYKFLDRLGGGGMGAVFKAEHVLMGRTVAIKLIRRRLLEDEKTRERFLREIKALGALQNPHVVTAHDADQVGSIYYLVMEYVDGKDLHRAVLQNGPLPVKWACEFCRQAALGLQHAHEKGFVHRDIKPSNLLAVREPPPKLPTIKILDFGLAHLPDQCFGWDESPPRDEDSHDMTSAVGTMGFMSPEQVLRPAETDPRADIFALGCTLFFLLTGHVPFEGEDDVEYVENVVRQEPLSARSFNSGVPAEIEAVIARMIARNPLERFQTALDVAAELLPFSASAADEAATSRQSIESRASIDSAIVPLVSDPAVYDPLWGEFLQELSSAPADAKTALLGPFEAGGLLEAAHMENAAPAAPAGGRGRGFQLETWHAAAAIVTGGVLLAVGALAVGIWKLAVWLLGGS